jgi:WD40 repeat protein
MSALTSPRGLSNLGIVVLLLTEGVHPVRIHAQVDNAAPAAKASHVDKSKLIIAQVSQPATTPPATDSLGDPLPEGALLRLGTSRFHSPSGVHELALSPDEQTVVSAGNQLIVWDTATGQERWRADAREHGFTLPGASYGMRAIAFTPDGQRFYTPGRQNEVILWETSTGRHETLPMKFANKFPAGPQGGYRAIDVAPDGQTVAFGSADGVIVVSARERDGYEIANSPQGQLDFNAKDRLRFGGHYSFVRFSPDGKTLAVVTSDTPEAIRLLESGTGQELGRIALKSWLVRLAFSPDGTRIVATERDNAVRLYDVDSKKELWSHVVQLTNPNENYTSAVAFSPDGNIVAACATDDRIHLMSAANGEEIGELKGHTWYPWSLAFTADSKTLYSSGWDGAVRRWDIAARKQLALPTGFWGTAVVAASPDGRTIAIQDDLGAIRIVDAEDGTQGRVLELAGTRYSQLTFSPDSLQLAGGGTSGDNVHVTVWDLTSWKVVHRWEWPKGRDPHSTVESLHYTPSGTRLAAAVFRQSAAYMWDLTTDKKIAQLSHGQIYGLSFSPDGETLATAGWDSVLRFWETETGKARNKLDVKQDQQDGGDLRMYTVCYAPQGGLIATAHLDGTVRVWRAADMTLCSTFPIGGRFVYGAMNFSPDGLWLATGNMEGRIVLWDPLTAQIVRDVGRHQGYVYEVVFGRDCRTLLSGGDDGVCYRWNLQTPAPQSAKELALLWDDLAGVESQAAFQAMRALSTTPDRTVALLAEKLRPIKSVLDAERIAEGISPEENQRLKDLETRLANKEKAVARFVTVRRALSLLAEIGNPQAIRLLKELADQDPPGDLGRLAAMALERPEAREQR